MSYVLVLAYTVPTTLFSFFIVFYAVKHCLLKANEWQEDEAKWVLNINFVRAAFDLKDVLTLQCTAL